MALLPFKPAHNLPGELSAEHDADFAPIFSFLQRSRYNFALTVQPMVYESHHQQFWASCSVSSSPNGRILNATIDAHPISITVETICRHLQLCDAGGRVSFTKDEVALTFRSMGYEGPLPSTTYLKGRVSYNYNYLIHLFLHCLSNKTGGWDQVPSDLASAIHGLVSNQLFNFSAFIFNNLVDNISSPKKFCMYPRFLQHMFYEEECQFSGNFTPPLPSMELPTPEGDSSVAPTDAEPTPSTSVPHPIKITYKRRRTPEQLSKFVQAPSFEPIKKKVKRTVKGTVPPKSMSQHIPENIQRDTPTIESASDEATPLDQRLSPRSPGSYHPEMPPTHTINQAQGTSAIAVEEPLSPTTQTLMRVVTHLQARFPDPEPNISEVDPRSTEGVNTDEAATTVDPNQDPQVSGTGTRTSPVATHTGEDFFEAPLNEGNPGCQETTTGDGGAGVRLMTPSPNDSTNVDEGTITQELTATITSLQARVAHLEAEVATLRLEVPYAGSGPEVREEEVAQDVNPSIDTLTNEWDDFLGTYFHDSTAVSSSSSEETEAAKETEQEFTITDVSMEPQSPAGTQQSPSGTKSPPKTTAQAAMEPVSPSGTEAAEDLSSIPEHSVDADKESTKRVGQPEGAVNAKVNSEAAAASEGPVIVDDSSTEELMANEPVGEAT
ncbi:hypothetical protein E3N88_43363 [Mikania micrantha]|uniref:Uncharacterized protein n=1 Tax=Mikania micrantha TaxID=192012 RepID=A0A5N6LF98_9ASTR|nr:hypothetical protein E3N88_43363 [Mikania micrantha]